MKGFLSAWIVFQLIIIGIAGATIINQVGNNTYDCSKKVIEASSVNYLTSMVFPLMFFTSGDLENYTQEYCDDKLK